MFLEDIRSKLSEIHNVIMRTAKTRYAKRLVPPSLDPELETTLSEASVDIMAANIISVILLLTSRSDGCTAYLSLRLRVQVFC